MKKNSKRQQFLMKKTREIVDEQLRNEFVKMTGDDVKKPRLGPSCKRLGIDYAKALVGWTDYEPILKGVVSQDGGE